MNLHLFFFSLVIVAQTSLALLFSVVKEHDLKFKWAEIFAWIWKELIMCSGTLPPWSHQSQQSGLQWGFSLWGLWDDMPATLTCQLFKLDTKYLQVRTHNVLSLADMYDTRFVQIQIWLPNQKSRIPDTHSSCNPCLENFSVYLWCLEKHRYDIQSIWHISPFWPLLKSIKYCKIQGVKYCKIKSSVPIALAHSN